MSACTSWSVLGRGVRHPYMYIITFKLSTNDPRQYMYVSIFSLFAPFSLHLATPSIHFPRLSSPFLPSLSLSFLLSLSSLFLLPLFSIPYQMRSVLEPSARRSCSISATSLETVEPVWEVDSSKVRTCD